MLLVRVRGGAIKIGESRDCVKFIIFTIKLLFVQYLGNPKYP
jgi:hypothetical protein